MKQVDGKFSTDGTGLFNTVSGERIPDDEPLFILRARDHHALAAIHAYQGVCEPECNGLHLAGIQQVREKFCRFAAEHPERMKQPGATRHLRLEAREIPEVSMQQLIDAGLNAFGLQLFVESIRGINITMQPDGPIDTTHH